MEHSLFILISAACSIAFCHTLIGPDHYVPFIALRHARNWSMKKTLCITTLCGAAHVLSSILLGAIGLYFGWTLQWLTGAESWRGECVAWLLTAFGLAYMIWGIHASRKHHHAKVHGESLTLWSLFIIFAFGPCEPLIPLLMFPAATIGMPSALIVAACFGVVTISTMLGMVFLSSKGIAKLPFDFHRYHHAMGGLVIFLSGVAINMGL